ncbi:MAG: aspartyl protease family protein [bacterium]
MRRRTTHLLFITVAAAVAITLGACTAFAETTLDRHARSVGTIDAIRDTRSLRITGRVFAIGLPGTFETLSAGAEQLVQRLDLGVVTLSSGLSGGEAWTVDPNGKTRTLVGEERREVISEAFMGSLAYLTDAGSAAVTELPAASDGAGAMRLSVSPPGGRARILVLDRENARLLRTIDVRDIDTMTVIYDDYREVDGLMLPFRVRQTTGDPAHDIVMEIDRIERNVAIDASAFRMPSAAAADYRFASGDRAEDIAITTHGAHLLARVMVNGRGPYAFFLDTGAGATCIDEGVARDLGLEQAGAIEAKGIGGSVTVSYVRVDTLAIGTLSLLSQKLVAIPLANIPGIESMGVRGILGYDFFSRFVVRLDYERELLSIYAPGAFTPSTTATAIPISLEGNVPSAAGVVDGRLEGVFRIDTGSGASLDLHAPFVARHRLLESAARVAHRPHAGVGGMQLSAVTRLSSFTLGPHVVRNLVVGLSESTDGVFATTKLAGNLGAGVLRRFTVIFDYEGKTMYVEPNANFEEYDRFDRSGMACWREAGALVALHVGKNTPAWRAGIRDGDEILAINGLAAASWDDGALAETLAGEVGRLLSVRYKRGGAIESVQFRLEETL